MDKKKKIALISIVSVLCVSAVIWGSVKMNKDKVDDPKVASESENTENQEEPAKANGSDLAEFETKIKDLGFTLFDEKSYDLFENDASIAFLQIEEDGVKLWLNDKASISNEKIQSALALLLPNTTEELTKTINGDITELATSLDNRTVSIKITEGRLELFITK